MTKLRPLGDRVVVRRIEAETTVAGGLIHIPEQAKEKPQRGEVIAAGRGKVNETGNLLPMDVKAGDLILFGKYSGTDVTVEGQEVVIMHEDDILGVIESA